MRIRINNISLQGTSRRVEFEPGLNIITGPIASGKTTLLRLVRSLLGGSLAHLPPEVRESVISVLGEVILQNESYSIIRPAITTRTTRVEIAGEEVALRLPFAQIEQESPTTYLRWILEQLDLPRLEVPSAPTKPESEPTPVSINDYLLYCTLHQEEIGYSVFGHTDPFKNIKRKYVFEIAYGIYNIETARIQDELRNVQAQLRELKNQDVLFSRFLSDTILENRAELEHNLQVTQEDLSALEARIAETSSQGQTLSQTASLRKQILTTDERIQERQAELEAERQAKKNLEMLEAQLETQIGKITRSIVAQKHLFDIDFVVCPRCGAALDQRRQEEELCYLCLQKPMPQVSRQTLIDELSRVEAQLSETHELLSQHQVRTERLTSQIERLKTESEQLRKELDFQTNTFVSAKASEISESAARRAQLQTRIKQFEEYLDLYRKLDVTRKWVKELAEQKEALQQELEAAAGQEAETQDRIKHLTSLFNQILQRFQAPEFGEQRESSIDPRTYLPIYHGRRFEDLSSPGLATLVNVAHALAHQRTSITLDLKLPNILFIDGLSEHLGEEGLDPQRLTAIYEYLIETSREIGTALQIIVIDNEVPEIAREYVRLELSDTERLIPPI